MAELDNRYASNGKGNAGVTLGTIGTALSGLMVLGGGLLNGGCNRSGWGNGECSDNTPVTRYEMNMQQELAAKDSKIALLEANTYNDQKSIEMYKYIDGELKEIRSELAKQAVFNQQTADSFTLVRKDIELEAERRCCGDNSIVGYVNATFYPKMVADVTTSTTTTAQSLYNPIPNCKPCNCNGN